MPRFASAAASWMAVVVLPTPPFWLTIAVMIISVSQPLRAVWELTD